MMNASSKMITATLTALALVFALALLFSGCSSDESSGESNTETRQVSAGTIAEQQPESSDGPSPTISFVETTHDFGMISQGVKATHTFIVRNTGDAPLRLISAKGS
jgi:PBP1b-binding outer membrane lipoprotein LpoB